MIRCWNCGVEPLELIDVSTLGEAEPSYLPGKWPPATDHEHTHIKPTPGDLLAAGAQAFDRVMEQWST